MKNYDHCVHIMEGGHLSEGFVVLLYREERAMYLCICVFVYYHVFVYLCICMCMILMFITNIEEGYLLLTTCQRALLCCCTERRELTKYLCICMFVYLYNCVFVCDLDVHYNHRSGVLVRGSFLVLLYREESSLYICAFVYLYICMFVYLCNCVFVYDLDVHNNHRRGYTC